MFYSFSRRAETAAVDSEEMREMRNEWEELWRLERQLKEEEAKMKAEEDKKSVTSKWGVRTCNPFFKFAIS